MAVGFLYGFFFLSMFTVCNAHYSHPKHIAYIHKSPPPTHTHTLVCRVCVYEFQVHKKLFKLIIISIPLKKKNPQPVHILKSPQLI